MDSGLTITATPEDSGRRLDQFLVSHLPDVSRARVQQLIEQAKVRVNGEHPRASFKLRGGEIIELLGTVAQAPLKARAEDIPLDILYEDAWLAAVNKPAGMMVHAGAGASSEDEESDPRTRGTLVNALLHHFQQLSNVSGELRPGIVHRLDKDTSGVILVAKDDKTHRKLAEQFSQRKVAKTYIALVHGWPKAERGTISTEISRDTIRRNRMTTRRSGGRSAISHWQVGEKFESAYGKFALLEVQIETGRTHQIRVHLSSIGLPVVGDALYGAPREIRPDKGKAVRIQEKLPTQVLGRNYLHAAAIEINHPELRKMLRFEAPLPPELAEFAKKLRAG